MIRLKELREARGLTQLELSEKVYISKNSISAYEIGRAEPSISTILAMADVLDCTTDELLGRTTNEEKINKEDK